MWTPFRSSSTNLRAWDVVTRIIGAVFAGWLIVWTFGGVTALIGNLVKYRAQYFPKDINPKYNHDLPPDPVMATTYWDIAERTKWLEGGLGLVRGLVTMLAGVLFALFVHAMSKLGRPFPKDPVSVTLFWLVIAPINVLTVRAITTPVLLPFFNIPLALETLLTPDERTRPWMLYLLPGLIPLILLQAAWSKLILPRVRDTLLTHMPHREWRLQYRNGGRLGLTLSTTKAVAFVLAVIDTIVSNPIDVLAVRLALMDVSDVYTMTGTEPVLSLRAGEAPYTGVWDCVRCIVDEEGVETLYRGWILALLARMSGVFKANKDIPELKVKEQDEEAGREKEMAEEEGDQAFSDEKGDTEIQGRA